MICPKCNQPVLDGKLVCTACVQRASHAAYMEMQRQLLPRVLCGEIPLTIGRVLDSAHSHIKLIGEPTHAWCGQRLSHAKRLQMPYAKLDLTSDLCPHCRSAIRDMAQELKIHAV